MSPAERLLRWLGTGGTIVSCALAMVALPLMAASAAVHAGSMTGMESMGTPSDGGFLTPVAQGLLVLSLPLMVLGLWGAGWPVRLLSAGSGATLYASMYIVPSGALFAAATGGLGVAYGWGWRRRRKTETK